MIYIACGSNLSGNYPSSDAVIIAAYDALAWAGIRVVKRSSIWLTRPVPVSDQPWFRNSVISVETALAPRDLLRALKVIEADFGRNHSAVLNAARVLDLDILLYNDLSITEEGLNIPHPRMKERPFVMLPLREIMP